MGVDGWVVLGDVCVYRRVCSICVGARVCVDCYCNILGLECLHSIVYVLMSFVAHSILWQKFVFDGLVYILALLTNMTEMVAGEGDREAHRREIEVKVCLLLCMRI